MKFTDPKLTTMVRPVELMGKQAVEMLLDDSENEKPDCIKVEATLHVGGSCAKVK